VSSGRSLVQLGWLLFLLGSIVFVVDAILLRDLVSAAGSVLFVVGVLAFLAGERVPTRCASCRKPLTSHPPIAVCVCEDCRAREDSDEPARAIAALASLDGRNHSTQVRARRP
jgi:hypothetical protein